MLVCSGLSFGQRTAGDFPGLVLTIRRGGDLPPAKVWLFTNNFAQMTDDEGNRSPKLGHLTGEDVLETADPCLDLAVLEGDGTIWETWLCLWSDEQVATADSDSSPVKPARPEVTGISRADLDQILAAGNLAGKKGDLDVLSPGDWALWGFLTTPNIQVIRTSNGLHGNPTLLRELHVHAYEQRADSRTLASLRQTGPRQGHLRIRLRSV